MNTKNTPFKIVKAVHAHALFMMGTTPGKSSVYAVAIFYEIEKGIAKLKEIRDDLPYDLIKNEVLERADAVYQSSEGHTTYLYATKALLDGLHDKACAGEPMPWETKQIIQRGKNANKK